MVGKQENATEREKSHLPAMLGLCVIIWATINIPGCAAATRNPVPNYPAKNDRMRNVIGAMIGAGEFAGWANVLDAMDPAVLPLTATFFVPSDDALSRLSIQAEFTLSVVQYHIVPQQLSYYDLQRLDVGMRLPTLLPNQTIVVTGNSQLNYTLDDALVTHPDILYDDNFALHGVADLLHFKRYGADLLRPVVLDAAPSLEGSDRLSVAPCLCKEFPVALTAVSVVLVVRFLRFPIH